MKPNKAVDSVPLKFSSIRYGAMKKLEIPSRKKMKQTTIFSFASNQMNNEPTLKEKLTLKRKIIPLPKRYNDNFEKNSPKKSKLTDKTNLNFNVFEKSYMKLNDKKNTDVTCMKNLIVTHDFLNGNQHPKNNNLVIQENGDDCPMNTSCKHNSKLIVHDIQENENEFSPNIRTDSEDMDYTMKFVSDSQGNKIFDHFSQKNVNSDCEASPTENVIHLTDSENQLYCNFEKDLFHEKFWQSTQKY